jgi:hypothetical protein
MSDELTYLQQWFADHSDGEWEHDTGIEMRPSIIRVGTSR